MTVSTGGRQVRSYTRTEKILTTPPIRHITRGCIWDPQFWAVGINDRITRKSDGVFYRLPIVTTALSINYFIPSKKNFAQVDRWTRGGHFESKFWCDAFGVVAWDWGLQCRQRTHTRAVKFPTYVITISQRYTDGRTQTDRQTDRQKTCCSNRRHRLIIRNICDVSRKLSPVEFFISVYSVSQKKSPPGDLTFFHFFTNGWEFVIDFLHTY